MGTDGTYRTSDLYVTAYLLSMGLKLLDIDRRDKRRCDFIFVDREDRSKLVHSFVCGQAEGNLPDFIYHLRRAKRLLYSREV